MKKNFLYIFKAVFENKESLFLGVCLASCEKYALLYHAEKYRPGIVKKVLE